MKKKKIWVDENGEEMVTVPVRDVLFFGIICSLGCAAWCFLALRVLRLLP